MFDQTLIIFVTDTSNITSYFSKKFRKSGIKRSLSLTLSNELGSNSNKGIQKKAPVILATCYAGKDDNDVNIYPKIRF